MIVISGNMPINVPEVATHLMTPSAPPPGRYLITNTAERAVLD
jgi:hypothetical protein